MTHSRTFRVVFVGSLTAASVLVCALFAWRVVWPAIYHYRIIRPIIEEIRNGDAASLNGISVDLQNIGAPAVPALIELLDDRDPYLREIACSFLGLLSYLHPAAIPALGRALHDEAAIVWRSAAESLSLIYPKSPQAVPFLVQALEDEDDQVRKAAAFSLAWIGLDGVPALVEALKHDDAEIRALAAQALGEASRLPGGSHFGGREEMVLLDQICNVAVAPLAKALNDPAIEVRVDAADSLSKIGPRAIIAVPTLLSMIQEQNLVVRDAAERALLVIAPEAAAQAVVK